MVSDSEDMSPELAKRRLDALGVNIVSDCLNLLDDGSASANAYTCTTAIAAARYAARAGLIPDELSWTHVFDVASVVQRTFDSWAVFGEAYAIELEAISDGRSSCRKRLRQLLEDPDSAWCQLDWRSDLSCRVLD